MGLHNIKDCGSKNSCEVCTSNRHHTSLHPDDEKCDDKVVSNKLVHINESNECGCSSGNQDNNGSDKFNRPSCSSETFNSYHVNGKSESVSQVLLGTIQAQIESVDGIMIPVRAVLDPGSQISAINFRLVKRLGLKIDPINISIFGIGETNAKPLGMVNCILNQAWVHSKYGVSHCLI